MQQDQGGTNLVTIVDAPPGYPLTPAYREDIRVRQSIRIWRNPSGGPATTTLRNIDPQSLERRVMNYYETYYAELGDRMARYPMRDEIFPDTLVGHRHIVVAVATDGIVVTHWTAEQPDFDFVAVPNSTVQDITWSDPLWASSGRSARFFQYDPGFDFGAYSMWRPELIEGNVSVKPQWMRMDVASLDSLDSVLNKSQAKDFAESDVQLSASAYLMGMSQEPPGKEQRDKVINELQAAIDGFEEVLDGEPAEEVVQMYLSIKRNRILLDPSAVAVTPKVKLGAELVPDFVVETSSERYVLVEIERPSLQVLTEKGRPRAELTHAQQQVKDWFDWISTHSEYARSLMPGISEPEGWVVIGRRSSIHNEHKHVLARENSESRRITTSTYDHLLDRAKQHLENLRNL